MIYTGNTETVVVKGEAITLSLLVWRRFKRQSMGFVERVLDMNPGLADIGPIIPVGTSIRFPIDAPELKNKERNVVHLWD
ncbi:tail protein X (plasmid) [Pseudochrobactrum algeriensis]|uniref:tail protein X n=1 Tax=Pseudochrobactrum TaxID=354349 RepID=UPI001BCE5011|nr:MULTISPECIES: tail protein X [Pseudochrobactrum]MBX8785235.1 phage tail protein [Ochrobactrum sp. GRS2]MBX8812402.1 phage tail protein [Ochrobactrum sp. MR34]QVQ35469.1 tail protein X [Pseudochrobactrum algeriensis]QVQ42085.1 tail protein X [Pseudochrobactrum algeriensis]QVQ42343.1 tail protein X [Pseudochrobactrum algeriensis]